MKLKRIFMTGVLATSMLTLAACGEDEAKPQENPPVDDGENKVNPPVDDGENKVTPPVDPVVPEPEPEPEDEFTLNDALDVLKNYSTKNIVDGLVEKYKGDNSYLYANYNSKDYYYDTVTSKTASKTITKNEKNILTLDDLTKVYRFESSISDETGAIPGYEYTSIVNGLSTEVKKQDKYLRSYNHPAFDYDEDDSTIVKLLAQALNQLIFGGNVIENFGPVATTFDAYKNKAIEYLEAKVIKNEAGDEVLDINAIKNDILAKAGLESVASIDPSQLILQIISPFLTDSKEEASVVHANEESKNAFIRTSIVKDGTHLSGINFNVDSELLALVLNDYVTNNKTLADFIIDAYNLDENAINDLFDAEKNPKIASIFKGIDLLVNKVLKMQVKTQYMLGSLLNMPFTDELVDQLSQFGLNFALNLDTKDFATKVVLPIEMGEGNNSTIVPITVYLALANNEFVGIFGKNISSDLANDETLASYKENLVVNDDLLKPFIGTIQPLAYASYLIDDEDATKSEINAGQFWPSTQMIEPYKVTIVNNDEKFEAAYYNMAIDGEGNPVKDPVTNKPLLSDKETGKVTILKPTEETPASINAYYNQNEFKIDENGIYLYYNKQNRAESIYKEISIKFNEQDVVAEGEEGFFNYLVVEEKNYDKDYKNDETAKVLKTDELKVRKIANGYELYETTSEDKYSSELTINVKKLVADDETVSYELNFNKTSDDGEDNEIKEEIAKIEVTNSSLRVLTNNNYKEYTVEADGTKKDVESSIIMGKNMQDITFSYDEELNGFVVTENSNDSYGRKSDEVTLTFEYRNDEEAKPVIEEIEKAITQYGKYNIDMTDAEFKLINGDDFDNALITSDNGTFTSITNETYTFNEDGTITVSGDMSLYQMKESKYQAADFLENKLVSNFKVTGTLDLGNYILDTNEGTYLRVKFSFDEIAIANSTYRVYEGSGYDVVFDAEGNYVVYNAGTTEVVTNYSDGVKAELDEIKSNYETYLEDAKSRLDEIKYITINVVKDAQA